MNKPKRSENDVKRVCMGWMSLHGYTVFRMNTGAFAGEHKGKKRFVSFGAPGMADIMAFRGRKEGGVRLVWIETKRLGNKQTELQELFQCVVENEGCDYRVAYGVDDLEGLE